MKAAQESSDTTAMLAAVRLNWQLWTIIQSELLAPDCPVPMDIRQNVLSLANFIDKHTVGIVGDPNPQMLDVLISINRELAGGLYMDPPNPAVEGDVPAAPPASGAGSGSSTDTSA